MSLETKHMTNEQLETAHTEYSRKLLFYTQELKDGKDSMTEEEKIETHDLWQKTANALVHILLEERQRKSQKIDESLVMPCQSDY